MDSHELLLDDISRNNVDHFDERDNANPDIEPCRESKTGISLNRHTMTKIMSAIVSNLEPNTLTVFVFLATQPSIMSVSPAVMYNE